MAIIEAAEVRRVRVALGEDQTTFGARFGKTRRTIIRWEKGGTIFSSWGGYDWSTGKQKPSPADAWKAIVAKAEAKAAKPAKKKRAKGVTSRRRARPAGRVTPRKKKRRARK